MEIRAERRRRPSMAHGRSVGNARSNSVSALSPRPAPTGGIPGTHNLIRTLFRFRTASPQREGDHASPESAFCARPLDRNGAPRKGDKARTGEKRLKSQRPLAKAPGVRIPAEPGGILMPAQTAGWSSKKHTPRWTFVALVICLSVPAGTTAGDLPASPTSLADPTPWTGQPAVLRASDAVRDRESFSRSSAKGCFPTGCMSEWPAASSTPCRRRPSPRAWSLPIPGASSRSVSCPARWSRACFRSGRPRRG